MGTGIWAPMLRGEKYIFIFATTFIAICEMLHKSCYGRKTSRSRDFSVY